MIKILKGEGYTQARLAGIMHEMLVEKYGRIPPNGSVTQYLAGNVISIQEEVEQEVDVDGVMEMQTVTVTSYALIIDDESQYFNLLPQIHRDRMVEYIAPVVEEGD